MSGMEIDVLPQTEPSLRWPRNSIELQTKPRTPNDPVANGLCLTV
jgi:hypothetical protein